MPGREKAPGVFMVHNIVKIMERLRKPLDSYDVLPPDMLNYLRNYGPHFTEKMCRFAVSQMRRGNQPSGKTERMDMVTKEKFLEMMSENGIVLENDALCDGLYVLNMAMSDFYGSSLPDKRNVCQFVKDYVDDADQTDGFIFNRFYADMSHSGIPIPWNEVL